MDNPPDPRPVYEADQVVLVYDLLQIRSSYYIRAELLPWWNFKRKFIYRVAGETANEILKWLLQGKKVHSCTGGHHHA